METDSSKSIVEQFHDASEEGKTNGSGNGLRSPGNSDSGPQGPNSGGASARAQDSTSTEEEEKVEDPAQRLLQHLEGKGLEAFHDEGGRPYMTVDTSKGRRTFAVRSGMAKEFLRRAAWRKWKEPLSKYKMEEATEALAAMARFDGPEKEVFLRVGHADGKVYLDLANDNGAVIEIDGEGWRVAESSPVPFLKTNSMKPLPQPERGGSLDELRPIINASEEANWIQMCGFLLAQFMPDGTMPILAIQGPQGSAKSSTAKRLRAVLDPSASNARAAPRNRKDVMVAAKNNFLLSYDNISGGVRGSISDVFCTLCSGGSMAGRALYTDDDEATITARRSTILNGIEELTPRGDLSERSLTVRLQRVEFVPETDLDRRFRDAHPRILGALLDAASTAIKRLPEVRADRSRKQIRLMDMADWIRAGEPALPFAEGSFLKALEEEQAKQRIDMMEGNVLAEALRLLADELEPGESFTDYATETRDHLAGLIENYSQQIDSKSLDIEDDTFPGNARALSQYLNRDGKDYELVTDLSIEQLGRHGSERKRQWRFTKPAA